MLKHGSENPSLQAHFNYMKWLEVVPRYRSISTLDPLIVTASAGQCAQPNCRNASPHIQTAGFGYFKQVYRIYIHCNNSLDRTMDMGLLGLGWCQK